MFSFITAILLAIKFSHNFWWFVFIIFHFWLLLGSIVPVTFTYFHNFMYCFFVVGTVIDIGNDIECLPWLWIDAIGYILVYFITKIFRNCQRNNSKKHQNSDSDTSDTSLERNLQLEWWWWNVMCCRIWPAQVFGWKYTFII